MTAYEITITALAIIAWSTLGIKYFVPYICERRPGKYNRIARTIITLIGSPVVWIVIIVVGPSMGIRSFIDCFKIQEKKIKYEDR